MDHFDLHEYILEDLCIQANTAASMKNAIIKAANSVFTTDDIEERRKYLRIAFNNSINAEKLLQQIDQFTSVSV